MVMSCVTAKRADTAFAAGMTFLADREPFASQPLGAVSTTVASAIQRGHYVLAIDDSRVVGFVVWSVMDGDTARRWFAGEITPSFDSLDGDTVVLMLGGGASRDAVVHGIRHIAARYAGRAYLINRYGRRRHGAGRFPLTTRAVEPLPAA